MFLSFSFTLSLIVLSDGWVDVKCNGKILNPKFRRLEGMNGMNTLTAEFHVIFKLVSNFARCLYHVQPISGFFVQS